VDCTATTTLGNQMLVLILTSSASLNKSFYSDTIKEMQHIIIFALCLIIVIVIVIAINSRNTIQHFLQATCVGVSLPVKTGYIFTNTGGVVSTKCDVANGYSGNVKGTYVCMGNYWENTAVVSGCTKQASISLINAPLIGAAPIVQSTIQSAPINTMQSTIHSTIQTPISTPISTNVQSIQSTKQCFSNVVAPPGYGTTNPPTSQLLNDGWASGSVINVNTCASGYSGIPRGSYTCQNGEWSVTQNPYGCYPTIQNNTCDIVPSTDGYSWDVTRETAVPHCSSGYIGAPTNFTYTCNSQNGMWYQTPNTDALSGCTIPIPIPIPIHAESNNQPIAPMHLESLKSLESTSNPTQDPNTPVIFFNDTTVLYTFQLGSRLNTSQFKQITGYSVMPNVVLILYEHNDYTGKETRIIGPVERFPLQSPFQSMYVTSVTSSNICHISDLKNQLPNVDDSDFSFTFSNIHINPLNLDGTNVFSAQSNCDITFASENNGLGNQLVYNSQYSQWGGCQISPTEQCNEINAKSVIVRLNPQPKIIIILYGVMAPFKYFTSSLSVDDLQSDVSNFIASIPPEWQFNSYEIKSLLTDAITVTFSCSVATEGKSKTQTKKIVLDGPTTGSVKLTKSINIQDIVQVSTMTFKNKYMFDVLDAPTLASKYSLGSTYSFLMYDTCNTVRTGTNTNDIAISNEIYNLCANA